jgi:hypothetical protein
MYEYRFVTRVSRVVTAQEMEKLTTPEAENMVSDSFSLMGRDLTKTMAEIDGDSWDVVSHDVFLQGSLLVTTVLTRRHLPSSSKDREPTND